MDNFSIDVTTDSEWAFKMALAIAFCHAPGGKMSHYALETMGGNGQRLILLWHECPLAIPLPYPMDSEQAVPFLMGWLRQSKHVDELPDFDGSSGDAYRVYVEDWGHIGSWTYSFAAIEKRWAWYGK